MDYYYAYILLLLQQKVIWISHWRI